MSNVFVTIKMCYVHNQWYDISCTTLYISNLKHDCKSDIKLLQSVTEESVTKPVNTGGVHLSLR